MHASDTRPLTLDRRRFLQVTAGAGVAAAAGLGLAGCAGKPREREPEAAPEPRRGNPVEAIVDPSTGSVEVNEDVIVRYSACLGCYSSCGNRVHIDRATGKMFGVGGNPYNPNNAYPYLDHTEPLESAYRSMSLAAGGQNVHGALCGRGNGTWDAYRQPDRITVPLKRAGKRGEGKWKPIGWDQLIEELCEGGKLFADLGEDREIEGFRALHDTSTPLDPDTPELGPVANQLVMVDVAGRPLASLNRREIARHIAYVAQQQRIPHLSVYDQVLLGRRPHVGWALSDRDRAVVAETIDRLGLEPFSARFLDELSGGERQKVYIARALAQEPEVLLLDEPTSALDPKNQLEVLDIVRSITRQGALATVLVIHDINLALRFCDRFLLVRDGAVVAWGGRDVVTSETLSATYDVSFRIEAVAGVPVAVPVDAAVA